MSRNNVEKISTFMPFTCEVTPLDEFIFRCGKAVVQIRYRIEGELVVTSNEPMTVGSAFKIGSGDVPAIVVKG